jgi:hypothetical protein
MYRISCSQRTDKRDEANGRFSQFANAHKSQVTITGVYKARADLEARGSSRSEDLLPPTPKRKKLQFLSPFSLDSVGLKEGSILDPSYEIWGSLR